ncbi:MAG: hypothetical protein ACYCWW_07035 [Deltaproteobacteria bacterium]
MANSNGNITPPRGTEKQLVSVLGGVQKILPATISFVVNGQSFTQPQLVQALTGFLALFQSARDAKTAYEKQLVARTAELPNVKEFLAGLKSALEAQLGKKNPELQAFGYSVAQRKALSSGQKAVAAAKRKQTREKFGTLGKRQKQATVTEPASLVVDPKGSVQLVPPAVAEVASSPESPTTAQSTGQSGNGPSGK